MNSFLLHIQFTNMYYYIQHVYGVQINGDASWYIRGTYDKKHWWILFNILNMDVLVCSKICSKQQIKLPIWESNKFIEWCLIGHEMRRDVNKLAFINSKNLESKIKSSPNACKKYCAKPK